MNKNKQIFLSCCTLAIFVFLAVASSSINKIHYGAFNYGNRVEDPLEKKSYVLLNDGTKIYGEKISWKSGTFTKDQIKIDDQKFKMNETRGYMESGVFYTRLRNVYIKRIVHGKVNVYVEFSNVTTTTTDSRGFTHTSSYIRTDQYAQKGEDGPLVVIGNQEDIKKMVEDCPLSVEMCSISNSKMRKAIKKNPNYLNNIFDVYNNGCKPVE